MTNQAIIIGGGIAGPVAAMALQRVGIQPVICEAYDRGADGVGAFLTLAVNGLEALKLLDLHTLITGLGMPTNRMRMSSGTGKFLADYPAFSHTIKRADLYQALRDEAVRRGVRIEYGKRLLDAKADGDRDRVVASFADGKSLQGDLLIGADGLRSRVREIIDPKAPRAHHVGLLNTGGFAHGIKVPGEPETAHFIFGKHCFFGYFLHPNGDVWWFANPPSRKEPTAAEIAAMSDASWRDKLLALFREDNTPACEIIAATDVILSGWNTYDFPRVPVWRNPRMVIIGDAAHAASPSSGQGASMAIEDAVTLAKCLRDVRGIEPALAAYEGLRRERVERVVQQGRRNGNGKAPGPIGRVIRDLVMPPLMRHYSKRNPMAWIYDYRIDWNGHIADAA